MKRLLDGLRIQEVKRAVMYDPWSFFQDLPVIETPRLRLRLPELSDATDMYAYCKDPEVARTVLWSAHVGIGETRAMLRSMHRNAREGRPVSWGMALKETGSIIGTIGFMWWNEDNRSAEVGYSLARAHWGKGIATEALGAVIDYSFENLRLNRIEAQHQVDNPASGAVMRHVGMAPEGVLRQRLYNKGDFVDVELMSILRQDWLKNKGKA